MGKGKTLLEEVSPHGSVQAIVEQDDRVVHFYLWGGPDSSFGTRSCWVRNLKPAPADLKAADMRAGAAPMLPRSRCKHPEGAPPLSAKELAVVWFEEGDAAALLAGSSILAVIPSWSGTEGFHGYARDCIGESSLCWELTTDNALHERVRAAADYWQSWDAEPGPWEAVQGAQLKALEAGLGPHEKYYAIDGGQWPPKAMVRLRVPSGVAFVTLGVCLRPQPGVEMQVENPADFRRIELGIALSSKLPEPTLKAAAQYLSGQTRLPWDQFTWLGAGHTLPCDVLKGFPAVVLTPSPPGTPRLKLPKFRRDPVTLLWMLPITEAERKLAMDQGSEALLERLRKAGHGWTHEARHGVAGHS